MSLKLGFIGTGAIGRDHIERLTKVNKGAEITKVYDIVRESAEKAVADFNLNSDICNSAEELIKSKDVDAIVVCSKNDTHFAPIMQAIELGKCVLTEKPMTSTAEESKKIVDAEVAKGKRFVQVGFNRRYDPAYETLKRLIDAGEVGELLMSGCRHYCAKSPTNYFTTEMMVNDALIHEIDILHYLFNDDYDNIEIKFPRANSLNTTKGLRDPMLAIITMKSGAIITVEVNMNSQYGYDIQCRVVGEKGIISLPEIQSPEIRKDGHIIYPIHKDWSLRFIESYNREFQAFIDSVTKTGEPDMPSAWDGYIASVTADAAIKSQKEGKAIEVKIEEKPRLYQI